MERSAFCYRFGTAEFDEARFELRVAGLPVDVERRALEVLAYLLRHAGEVVTKDELLREVWAGRITVDKVLPNAINKLRRALGEANASHISTQARVGYRLDGAVTRTAVGRQLASTLALSPGQAVPGRVNFVLLRQLGRTTGSEVWLAEHQKTREQRVYKFGLDVDRLRALKREATLLRVLQDSLEDTSHVVEILDWNFELSPYFLECKYGGSTLAEWTDAHLSGLDAAARIALFLQIADAVAAAHSVGVLHKDLKPANVLVTGDAQHPHVRLTDFGSGHLLEPDRLAQLGITRMGMTVEDSGGIGSTSGTSGTPLYIAPEHFEGHAPTVKSDVFALGILLYQLLSGRIGLPMVSGWETAIDDELLREDLRLATDGSPERRLASVAELADRLRRLDERRADMHERQSAMEAARRDRESLARAQTRRPFVRALVAALALGVVVAVSLQQQAVSARNQARTELDRATALARFLNEDLIGRSNPLVSAKGPDATLREVLLSARDRVPARFAAQPDTAAAIHSSLASLFNAVDLFSDAEAQARRALELLERHGGASSSAAIQARTVLVRVLSRLGRFDDAEKQLNALEELSARTPDPVTKQRVSAARSTLLMGRGEFAKASVELRAAVDGLDAAEPGNTAQRDSLRLDLIATLAMAGQDEQARAQGRALLEQAAARKDNNDLLIALTRLALVRAQGEDHAAADKLLMEAQPVIVARLGENHSRHLQLLGELLGVAFRRGDWPRAAGYAQQVHERARAKFGDKHVLSYVTLANWARTLHEAGRAKDAVDKASAAHEQLQRLVGPKSPQTQDAAFVLALIALDLGDAKRGEALIGQLDPAVLESGRATGLWPAATDALRGIALQLRGDAAKARPLLDSALAALKDEETLAQPSRLYVVAKNARTRLP
jgi:eukaryotic-like serine/threonine-protein kinase